MKLLCYGDSNTYGYDPRSPLGECYPECWVDFLDGINLGENGRCIPWRSWEFSALLEAVSQVQPDRVLVFLGTNDILTGVSVETIEDRMKTLLQKLQAVTSPVLLSPLPISLEPFGSTVVQVEGVYEALGKTLGVPFCKLGQWDFSMAYDGVHLSQLGHQQMGMRLFHWLRTLP